LPALALGSAVLLGVHFQMRGSVVLSSLPLQVLFYFNYYLLWVYYIIAIISFIYKGEHVACAVTPAAQFVLRLL
jgi:hypothetical protein